MKRTVSKIAVGLLPVAAVAGLGVYYTGNANAAVTNAAAVAVCRTADTRATITAQGDIGGKGQMGLVTLTNVSGHACRVDGRASVSLANAAAEVVSVPTKGVNQPGKATAIVLKPKASAYEGIKWQPCAKSDLACGVGNTLLFNLQASTDGAAATLEDFPSPERSDITMRWLQVGTLQPSRQGVVAW